MLRKANSLLLPQSFVVSGDCGPICTTDSCALFLFRHVIRLYARIEAGSSIMVRQVRIGCYGVGVHFRLWIDLEYSRRF